MDTPSRRNISEVQCGVLKVMHGTEQRGITKRLPMQRMDHTSALRWQGYVSAQNPTALLTKLIHSSVLISKRSLLSRKGIFPTRYFCKSRKKKERKKEKKEKKPV